MTDKGKTVPTRYTYAGKGEPAPFAWDSVRRCKVVHVACMCCGLHGVVYEDTETPLGFKFEGKPWVCERCVNDG